MSRQLMSDGGMYVNEGMVSYTVYPIGSTHPRNPRIELPKAMKDDLKKYKEYMLSKVKNSDNSAPSNIPSDKKI